MLEGPLDDFAMTTATASAVAPRRSGFVTALAWLVIVTSALLTPISLISLLMILAKSYGTQSTTVLGFLGVVVAPPAGVVVGIGLLRRRPWAWWGVLVLLVAIISANVHSLATARATDTSYTSPSGVKTTILASPPNHFGLPLIALCGLILARLCSRAVRDELGVALPFGGSAAGATPPTAGSTAGAAPGGASQWRVGHRGRDCMYYEERHFGRWRHIEISGEMLMGRAHHVIYFASPSAWRDYPAWAHGRRDEIIARIKSAFQPPDYEYHGDDGGGGAAPHAPPRPIRKEPLPLQQRAAIVLVVCILGGLAGGMAWLVKSSIDDGTTILPAKQASVRRSVSRTEEPVMFWVAVGLYAGIGLGSAGLLVWGAAQVRRR